MRTFINSEISDADMVTVENEVTTFPKENMLSNILIEKTKINTHITIDFGSAVNITAFGCIGEFTQIILEANATDSWGGPSFSDTYTEDNFQSKFIDETYRFFRLTMTNGADPIYCNHLFLGSWLQLPGYTPGSTPDIDANDILNETPSRQIYATAGVPIKKQSFSFKAASLTVRNNFLTWYETIDRANNNIIIQHEEDLISLPPYYGKVTDYKHINRDRLLFDFNIDVQEAK